MKTLILLLMTITLTVSLSGAGSAQGFSSHNGRTAPSVRSFDSEKSFKYDREYDKADKLRFSQKYNRDDWKNDRDNEKRKHCASWN
jgi:hypothetical protein